MVDFVQVDGMIVETSRIKCIDVSTLKSQTIRVTMVDDSTYNVDGFAAVELVWLLKPSAIEGLPYIKWNKHAWIIHNMVAHPLMQILAWFKLYKLAIAVHDKTVPKPVKYK